MLNDINTRRNLPQLTRGTLTPNKCRHRPQALPPLPSLCSQPRRGTPQHPRRSRNKSSSCASPQMRALFQTSPDPRDLSQQTALLPRRSLSILPVPCWDTYKNPPTSTSTRIFRPFLPPAAQKAVRGALVPCQAFLEPCGELFRQVPQFTMAPSWSEPVTGTIFSRGSGLS